MLGITPFVWMVVALIVAGILQDYVKFKNKTLVYFAFGEVGLIVLACFAFATSLHDLPNRVVILTAFLFSSIYFGRATFEKHRASQ